jgi:hypothetical protein
MGAAAKGPSGGIGKNHARVQLHEGGRHDPSYPAVVPSGEVFGSKPAQESTGRRGYLGKRGSVNDSSHNQ